MVTVDILLYAVIVAFLVLCLYHWRSRFSARVFAGAFIVLWMAVFYYWSYSHGEGPWLYIIPFLAYKIPVLVAPLVAIGILLIKRSMSVLESWNESMIMVVSYAMAVFVGAPHAFQEVAVDGADAGTCAVYLILLAGPFMVAVMAPIARMKTQSPSSYCKEVGLFSFGEWRAHTKLLMKSAAIVTTVMCTRSVLLFGNILHITVYDSVWKLLRMGSLVIGLAVLTVHFVCFGQASRYLDKHFGPDKSIWFNVIILAALYMTTRWAWDPASLIAAIPMGVVFAVVYLRTGSLMFGIIADGMLKIFFSW